MTHLSCPAQFFPNATAVPHPEERLQDDHPQVPLEPHLSLTAVNPMVAHSPMESTMKDLSCLTQLAHATAASPEKRLQINSVDLTTLHPSLTYSEKCLHNDHVQLPDLHLSPPTLMENMKNDSCPSQLAPHATAASPEKRL